MEGKLNIKKVVVVALILILFVVSIIVFAISRLSIRDIDVDVSDNSTTQIFTDVGSTISIEMPKKYNLKQAHNNEYLIKLTSDENADIYVSKIEKIDGRNLYTVARADRLAYLEAYNVYSNLSDLKELEVNGNKAYMYSFHYLDENLKEAFYIQVVLLEMNEEIFIFDIDFPLDDLVLYTNMATEVLSTFKKL